MKQAIIFGISGQDGAYLADLLLQKNYRVLGTSRNIDATSFSNLVELGIRDKVSLHSVALTDAQRVRDVLTAVRPDEIYHLAGMSSVSLSFERPVEAFTSIGIGTLHILEAMRSLGGSTRLFYASSGDCFGNTGDQAATEETPFVPQSPYAIAKTAAHEAVAVYRKAYGLFACSGLLFNHESPLRPKHFVTRKIVTTVCRIAAGSGERLHLGNINVARDWGYALEYVDAMWHMLQQESPTDYIVATGTTITLRDFMAEAFAAVGLDWRDHVDVDASLFRPTDVTVSRANPAKAAHVLGWKAATPPTEMVRLLVAHEQDQRIRRRAYDEE